MLKSKIMESVLPGGIGGVVGGGALQGLTGGGLGLGESRFRCTRYVGNTYGST